MGWKCRGAGEKADDGVAGEGGVVGGRGAGIPGGGGEGGVLLRSRGEEITSLALLSLLDLLLPSLPLPPAGQQCASGSDSGADGDREPGGGGTGSASGGHRGGYSGAAVGPGMAERGALTRTSLARLMTAAEAVASARRPDDGTTFPAHVRVGASVRAQLLLLLRA